MYRAPVLPPAWAQGSAWAAFNSSEEESVDNYNDRCLLISGIFATVLQGALAVVALLSLVFKRMREKPPRPWNIWAMDASKQAASAATAHLMNLMTAMVMAWVGAGDNSTNHQCSWYLITFLFDTTTGSLFSYLGTVALFKATRRCGVRCMEHSGYYGDPPRIAWWAVQIICWILIVFVARVLNAMIEYSLHNPLDITASYLGYPLRNYPKLELTIIMILCPVCLNVVQMWIQDQFLKRSSKKINLDETAPNARSFLEAEASASAGMGDSSGDEENARRPLLRANSGSPAAAVTPPVDIMHVQRLTAMADQAPVGGAGAAKDLQSVISPSDEYGALLPESIPGAGVALVAKQ